MAPCRMRGLCLSVNAFTLFLVLCIPPSSEGQPGQPDASAPADSVSRKRELENAFSSLEQIDCEGLRQSIDYLASRYNKEYPRGKEYLNTLSRLERERLDILALHGLTEGNEAGMRENAFSQRARDFIDHYRDFERASLIANPLITSYPILFIVRGQYKPDQHNTATIFQNGEVNTASFTGGGSMKVLDFGNGGTLRTLIDVPEGIVRDPEIHFSGKKIVFSMRENINDDYHIYEINSDGSDLKKLTFAAGVSDIDPLYLPDDSIVFSSTREPKYGMCNQHIMANLFKMESDGANIHQIGKNTLFEGHGSLMPDGRILYDRWVSVDRNFGDGQGIWTVYPDGAKHALYWGGNTNSPGSVIDARIIPGSQQAICVIGSFHDLPWGALAIIDRRLGLDGRQPVIRTWPADAVNLIGKGDWDIFKAVDPKYEDPFVLDDRYFLCSRMTGNGEQMGIYLIDTFGNEVLLHTEGAGCYDPMPLRPQARPNIIPARRNFDNADGRMYVLNVYEGTHMAGVEPGTVKYLRVVESPEKRSWNYHPWGGQGTEYPAMNWHDFNSKRILGTVPVEKDGSVFFSLSSERFVYFQLLDENGMMVQSMRSGTMVQSGEIAGCMGCHEDRRTAPPVATSKMPLALQREPSRLNSWYGEPRMFSYMREVQPVFDRSCVRCHDYGKPAGEKLNLAPDRTLTFNTSYTELWLKKIIASIGAGPAEIQQPYSWGSHKSRLVEVVSGGHHDIKLDRESFDRLITWIDINAPYYPVYETAYPDNLAGRSPLDDTQLQRLTELTGVPFTKLAAFDTSRGPQVNFDSPELSPCLSVFVDTRVSAYREALSIIETGRKKLLETPRADMDGFRPCIIDQLRNDRYLMRRQIELRNRKAIRDGVKVYDEAVK